MNFTLEKLKEARDAGISDEVIWNTAIKADQRFSQAKEKNIPLETAFGAYQQSLGQPTQPAAPATFAEGAEDIGRKFLMGGVGGIRSITNILGASNPLSKSLAGVEDYIAEGLSAESQGNSRAISELFQKVEEKGLWDKFQAGLEAFKMAPSETLAQTAGYMIPNLVAGLAGKAAQFGRAGLTAVQAGVGATMGAGIVKGEIYEGTYEYLKQSGLSEEEARKRADEAQASLGKNLDQIFLAAGLGAVASTTGAEKIITRMLSRTGKEVSERSIKEVLKAGLGGAAGEAVFETIQEGQEKVASNKALQREGADVDTFAGVPQVMGMAAPAAAILGGGAGAISVLSTPEQAAERRIERDSNQAARELSVPAGDTTGQIIVNDIGQKENEIANLKEALQEQDINSPQGQELLLAIRYAETQLNALKKQAGETVESEQARLAREIATPVESTVQQDLTVQTTPDTTATTAEAPTVTPAPVSETITPAEEAAPVTTPAPAEAVTRILKMAAAPVTRRLASSLDTNDFTSAQALADQGATMDRATFLRSITPSATQRATTIHTRLENDGIISKEEFSNEKGLVYGDGRGAASQYLGAKSYEPFPPAGFTPDYTGDRVAGSGAPIGKKFSSILNTFVLNVVDPQTRTFIVKDIANLLQKGGRAVFVTRGTDVANSKALVSFGPLERIQRSEGKLTYQKGFTQPELIQYLQETLGDGFSVRALRGGTASDVRVEVVKNTDAKLDNPPIVPAFKKIATPVRVEEKVQPVPEADRYTFEEAGIRSIEFFGGKAPDGLLIVNDTTNPNYEMKAGYDPETGDIILNRAYIKKGESIEDILTHELGHYIFSDPKFQADFKNFLESMPDDTRAEIEAIINQSYNKDTNQTQIEERQVMAFTALVKASKQSLSAWENLKNTIKRWINKVFKTNIKLSDEGAMAVFNVGFKRFKSGEQIVRAMDEGKLKTAPEGMTQMDRDYLAAVERGDMETAQRMVDEAAKKAGYEPKKLFHGTLEGGFTKFDPEKIGSANDKGWFGKAFWFSDDYGYSAANYAGEYRGKLPKGAEVKEVYLKLNNPKLIPWVAEDEKARRTNNPELATQEAINEGHDGFLVQKNPRFGEWYEYGVFNPSQIKSADPVTYDDAGNVIPLSQRFRATSPDIRRMAAEPRRPAAEETGTTPESPEGQSVPAALANGIDIGPENNMPPARKIESHLKNFLFLRGFFQSASDRLRRNGFVKLGNAIDTYFDEGRRRIGDANKIMLAPLEAYEAAPAARRKKIEEDFQTFYAAQENGRDTDAIRGEMDPIAVKIVDAWQKFGEMSGKENQRVGVKVYDPSKGTWRKIGRVEKFWPRRLKPEYQRALMDPDKYAKEYNEIVEALLESGQIKDPVEAEKYLREYSPEATKNDYFSGIEKARGKPLPEKLYDYSMPVMTDYISRWAHHVSRIEQFGQKTTEDSKTLWDREMETTRDPRTRDYIQAARERVEGYFPNDPFLKGTSALNIWATGLQLGNPASAVLNLIGGSTLNAMIGQPGALGSYVASFAELRNLGQQMRDAKEKGVLGRDLMNIVGDHQAILETNGFAKAGQKTADFLLKWAGFTPAEQMIRTQSLIIGKSFVRNALNSFKTDPNGQFARRSQAWLSRNGFDIDKLIVEEGVGQETDRVLRYFSNIAQGSYTIDQVPIFIDMPVGRFLFKYQKFSTQVMRMSWKNTFEPLFKAMTGKGETIQIPDKVRQDIYRLKVAEARELGDTRKIDLANIPKTATKGQARALALIPAMMWLGSAYVGGEILLRMRDILFGVLMKGPDYEDMIKALEDDERAAALYLASERAWYNLIGIGALGLIGNYAQFFMDWQDRERVKNPLDPPALSMGKDTWRFIETIVDQGTVTAGDIDNYTRSTVSAYRSTKKLAESAAGFLGLEDIPGIKEEMFRREVASINKYARRWAADSGIEYRLRRPTEITATPRTPVNRKITAYLQTSQPQVAAAYAKAYLNTLDKQDRKAAIQSLTSSARNRQPLRLGTGPMDESERKAFLRWLKGKVSAEKYEKVAELDKQYQRDYKKFLRMLPNR
jgi:hypothetical protein